MGRMFQIHEDDLAELEKTIPLITGSVMIHLDARLRTLFRRTKQILSNVRWDYGPPEDVEVIPVDE